MQYKHQRHIYTTMSLPPSFRALFTPSLQMFARRRTSLRDPCPPPPPHTHPRPPAPARTALSPVRGGERGAGGDADTETGAGARERGRETTRGPEEESEATQEDDEVQGTLINSLVFFFAFDAHTHITSTIFCFHECAVRSNMFGFHLLY